MPNAQKVNYLRGKDLITIGIFSAIYFVLNFICMLISGLHPLVWILMPMNIAIVTGFPSCCCAPRCRSSALCFSWGSSRD